MSILIEEQDLARARVDVYPQDQVAPAVATVSDSKAYIKRRGDMEFIKELRKAGLHSGPALLLVEMLWCAGDDLKHSVSARVLAEALSISRPGASRAIRRLHAIGVIEKVLPETRPSRWRFPKHDELIRRVRASSGRSYHESPP